MNIERLLKVSEGKIEVLLAFGGKVVGALVLLSVAWVVSKHLRNFIEKRLTASNFDITLSRFFANLSKYAVITFAVVSCLGIFGVETASFAAVLAATGFAVGMALQGTLSNFSSGIMLLIFRPFKVGDFVVTAGQSGTVHAIDLFSITVDTLDHRRIIIPNSSVYGSVIENVTYHPYRRTAIVVGTSYDADMDEVRKVLNEAVTKVDNVLNDPAPQVVLTELGASSVDWTVRLWARTDDFWTVRENAIYEVKRSLDQAKIGIPYPQMDVHLDKE